MNKKFERQVCLMVFWVALLVSPPVYAESDALKSLKIHIARVQQVLTDARLADGEHRDERRRLAVNVLHQMFDFEEMSRRSLGTNGRRYSDRLQEFTPLFVALLEQVYIGKLEEHGDAKIEYVKEIVDGRFAEVRTQTKLKDGTQYSVDYKLVFSPAGWRVYDVIGEGVSVVSNYRAQFDRFLSKHSFDELLRTLAEKKVNLG
jgi:phospholipid transport system substrate-binding protein